jgi:3-oxoacyl-[acyl-carrier-protein] synthase II
MSSEPVVVAWSLYLPGVDLDAALPELAAASPQRAAEPAYPPERARELLGRKGLLNKEPATRLALCAVHRALRRPPGAERDSGPPDPRVAVVASSNLGNVATVVDVVRSVRAAGRTGVSPLAAPNVSSNVLASAVAIWFRFGGPNLMVCSGSTGGLDALALGALLLRAGRADRVVVVGAEPADDVAAAMSNGYPQRPGGAFGAGRPSPALAGAACVVIEPGDGGSTGARLGRVRASAAPPEMDKDMLRIGAAGGRHDGIDGRQDGIDGRQDGIDGRHDGIDGRQDGFDGRQDGIDLVARCGDLYGALGVAQAAVATALVCARARPARIVCGDAVDGWRTVDVDPPYQPCSADVLGRSDQEVIDARRW